MSAYRYVVFPSGRQPTVDEVRQLQEFAGLLANHFAWGVARDDGRLALAAELSAFDHAREIDAGFDALVRTWELHGCELLDHLKFVKDAEALRPTSRARRPTPVAAHAHGDRAATSTAHPPHDGHAAGDALHAEGLRAAKQLLAHEATAKAMLGADRRLQRFAALQRLAVAGPYALIALAAAATIGAGLYIRNRVTESGRESRQETIEQMVDAPPGDADDQKPDE
jgi:hypothetical protein